MDSRTAHPDLLTCAFQISVPHFQRVCCAQKVNRASITELSGIKSEYSRLQPSNKGQILVRDRDFSSLRAPFVFILVLHYSD